MKKFFFVILVLLLAACGQAPQPTPTEAPVVVPTNPPVVVEPTATVAPAAEPTAEPTATLPPAATQMGSGIFQNITYSGDIIYFHCEPSAVEFEVTVTDPNAATIVFFFRMRDKSSNITSNWSAGQDMRLISENRYGFTMEASAVPDNARWDEAWLQFQIIALNQYGQRYESSDVYGELVTFMKDCP